MKRTAWRDVVNKKTWESYEKNLSPRKGSRFLFGILIYFKGERFVTLGSLIGIVTSS